MNKTGTKVRILEPGNHLFRNRRNTNKYIQVTVYENDRHYYYKNFMHWENGVTNVLGQRRNKLLKVSRNSLIDILEDYSEVPVDYTILP